MNFLAILAKGRGHKQEGRAGARRNRLVGRCQSVTSSDPQIAGEFFFALSRRADRLHTFCDLPGAPSSNDRSNHPVAANYVSNRRTRQVTPSSVGVISMIFATWPRKGAVDEICFQTESPLVDDASRAQRTLVDVPALFNEEMALVQPLVPLWLLRMLRSDRADPLPTNACIRAEAAPRARPRDRSRSRPTCAANGRPPRHAVAG